MYNEKVSGERKEVRDAELEDIKGYITIIAVAASVRSWVGQGIEEK